MKKRIIAMALSVAMMLTMFPTGVLADDFIENTEGVTVSAEGQSNDDQGEESDTAQVNAVENEETQPETVKPENEQTEPGQTGNDQTEPTQNEPDQAAPDQTETNQTEQTEPGSTVPDQAGTTPDDKQPEPEQPATDPAKNGVSDGAESTEGEQAESKTEFTVTWVSEGETILTKTFAEGTSKDEVEDAQPAEDPVKEADGDVAYEFAGWTPDYADVTADQTYTAKFEEAEQDEMVSTASLVEPAADIHPVEVGKTCTLTGAFSTWNDWKSSDTSIATVAKDYLGYKAIVTGKKAGFATITHTYGRGDTETFTVKVVAADIASNEQWAQVYYLKDPDKFVTSNDASNFGDLYDIVKVDTTNMPWDSDGKNYSGDGIETRVIDWQPYGYAVVPEGEHWDAIFNNFKESKEEELGVTIEKDDVTQIRIVPAKISHNNGTTPDYHVDCNVEIYCKDVATVRYFLKDAGAANFNPLGAKSYVINGESVTHPTDIQGVAMSRFPAEKIVDGVRYKFVGWQKVVNGGHAPTQVVADTDFGNTESIVRQSVTGNADYYAEYVPVAKLKVTYDLDGGNWQGTAPAETELYEGETYTVTNVTPEKQGYTFGGWEVVEDSIDGNTKFNAGDTFTMLGRNVTLKAQWIPNTNTKYTVEHYLQNVTGNGYTQDSNSTETKAGTTGAQTNEQAKSYTGFTAVQPIKQETIAADGNTVVKIYYDRNTHKVTYTDGVDDEEVFADQVNENIRYGATTPAFVGTPTRTGYKFTGWNPKVAATVTSNVTYVAQWEQSQFGVTYQYAGEVPENAPAVPGSQKATYNDQVTVAATPSLDGYTFTGWKSEDVSVDQDGKFTMPAKNVTFTGTWEKRTDLSYTVHYYWNGTTEKVHKDKVVPNKTYGEEVTEKVVVTIDPGYTPVNSAQEETITIGAGTNEITFYYYKNVELTANSDTKTYNGDEQSVSGFTGAPEGADFSKITVGATGTNAGTYPAKFPDGTNDTQKTIGTVDTTGKYIVTAANNGQLTVSPVAIELTANSAEKPYDGKALTANGYEITKGAFADKEGLASVTVEGSQTLVGSSDNTIKAHTLKDNTKAENYTISYKKGTLTVTNRTEKYGIKVEANSGEKTYNGKEQKVTGFVTDKFTVNGQEYTVSGLTAGAEGTDAGEYTATVTGTAVVTDAAGNVVTDQFNVTTVDGKLTIKPVEIELTANSAEKPYDGTALTANGYKITKGVFADKEGLASVTVEGSQTLVGSSDNTIKAHTLKDNTKAKNYTISYKKGTLTVTNRTEKYGIKVEANSGEKIYNGKEQKVTGFVTDKFTVNGQEYTVSGLTAGAEGTDAGEYTATVTGTAVVTDAAGNVVTDQFNVTTVDGKLTIKPVEIELTANSAEKPYDGTALTANGYEITKGAFADKEGLASVTVEGSQTLVGSSDNTIKAHTLKDNTKAENYSISYQKGTLKVTDRADAEKYQITVEANSGTKTYNGGEQKINGFVTNEFTVNDQKYTVSGLNAEAKGTDAGKYTTTVTGTAVVKDVAGNDVTKQFTVTSKPGTLTIKPYMISIEPTVDKPFLYNGKEPQVEKYTIDGEKPEGLLLDHKIASYETYGSGVDVGEYDRFSMNNAKIVDGKGNDVTANYWISYSEKTMTITPAPLTVTTEGGSKVYDGKPLTNEVGNIAGLVNGETAKVKTTGSQTNVGTSDNTYVIEWDTAKVGNYKVTQENLGKLEVTAQSINPDSEKPDEKDPAYGGVQIDSPSDSVYDGTEHKWVPTALDKDGNALTDADYKVTYSTDNFTDVTGTITVTITGDGNYTGTVTRTYKITPAPLKITTNSAEKTYDGSALTADGKIEGLVKGETATLKTTGSQTEVGESKNTYEIEWGTAKETNYKIAEEDIGTLKVNARSGGGSSSKPTPEDEPTPTPTPTPLPTLPTTPAPTTPTRRVTRSTATVTEPASRPTEQITENETPKAESEPEVIEDEETPLAPMAGGAWALVNLILMLLTVLASLLLLLGYLGKKKYAKEDEYGNALHDANGNEIIDYTRNKKGFWRVASLIPAIAAVIAFALTENMRLPMVMTDRWTLLMVIIAVVQLIVAVLCKKKKESEEDENQANA